MKPNIEEVPFRVSLTSMVNIPLRGVPMNGGHCEKYAGPPACLRSAKARAVLNL
jgi:hypothetical protein